MLYIDKRNEKCMNWTWKNRKCYCIIIFVQFFFLIAVFCVCCWSFYLYIYMDMFCKWFLVQIWSCITFSNWLQTVNEIEMDGLTREPPHDPVTEARTVVVKCLPTVERRRYQIWRIQRSTAATHCPAWVTCPIAASPESSYLWSVECLDFFLFVFFFSCEVITVFICMVQKKRTRHSKRKKAWHKIAQHDTEMNETTETEQKLKDIQKHKDGIKWKFVWNYQKGDWDIMWVCECVCLCVCLTWTKR